MINFAVIGSNWISEKFVNATRLGDLLALCAVYSRTLQSAQLFADKFAVTSCYDSLQALANDDNVQAVYIASPNSLHFEQTMQMLSAGKHVICEKPLASNATQVEQLFQSAIDNNVILFEAYMTAHLPNFQQIKNSLPHIGKLRKANLHYCQYSSRYPAYLAGESPNTFSRHFSGGSIMDIGYYCVAFSVALFGKPNAIQADATLLDSGVDGCGSVILDYGDFSVTIEHSKIGNSQLINEIQGENGSLIIEHIAQCQRVSLFQQSMNELTLTQSDNCMLYEVQFFAQQINNCQIDMQAMQRAKTTAVVITEIRRLTDVIFPADKNQK